MSGWSDIGVGAGYAMKLIVQRLAPLFLFSFVAAWATPGLSQAWRLDCEITNYGAHYSSGESREVAKSWLPETSTHVISIPSSYHVEFGVTGTATMPPNRFVFRYRPYGENGVATDLLYTYLTRSDILTAKVIFGGNYYNIDARGRCRAREITAAQAEKLLP